MAIHCPVNIAWLSFSHSSLSSLVYRFEVQSIAPPLAAISLMENRQKRTIPCLWNPLTDAENCSDRAKNAVHSSKLLNVFQNCKEIRRRYFPYAKSRQLVPEARVRIFRLLPDVTTDGKKPCRSVNRCIDIEAESAGLKTGKRGCG